jgi:tRNA dimethylallyltransferase
MKPKLVIVLGPTVVGKSDLAINLAQALDGEIINADSQQVYRGLNIGTGKPSTVELEAAPHHLIDVVDPDEEFNVAVFRRLATQTAKGIWSRRKTPIVCGGTGLYLKALTRGLFVGPSQDKAVRKVLDAEIEKDGLSSLYERLRQVDPAATYWIHPNDRQRITRALEVYELTGKPMSVWQSEHGFRESPFEPLKIGLDRPRDDLYKRINERCEWMIQQGLVEEVKGLIAKGYSLELKPLQSVGYRHAGLFLAGVMPLADAVTLMKRDTRRLAKRQLTWFRGDKEIRWFHPDKDREQILRVAKDFLT